MNGKNLLKKLRRTAAITTAALAVGAGSALGYSVGCPEGNPVKISYVSEEGPREGKYSCVTAKGEPNPKEKRIVKDYDSFNLLEGNGAQFLAYTQNQGWHTADPNNLKHKGFSPYGPYSQSTFKVKSILQEKPMVPTQAPVAVYSPRYTYITIQQPKAPEAPKEKSGIFARVSKSKDVNGYAVGFSHGNFGFGLEAGKGNDENLERTSITSPTGRTLDGSLDKTNQKYLGAFIEGNVPVKGWSLFGGVGIRKWDETLKTNEKILDSNGTILASDTNSQPVSENSWTVHAGAGVDLGESLRTDILATYDSKLKELVPGLGVSVKF